MWRETAWSEGWIGLSLAAVEPAPAEAGENAGERRQCDDDVARISFGEHSRKSFRVTAWSCSVVGRGNGSDTPLRGIPPWRGHGNADYVNGSTCLSGPGCAGRRAQRYVLTTSSELM